MKVLMVCKLKLYCLLELHLQVVELTHRYLLSYGTIMNLFRFEYPSVTTVPNAGKRLLETDVKFFISPLECRRNSKGNGDLVSDIGVVIVFQPLQILMTQKQDGHFSCMPETFYAHKRGNFYANPVSST